MTSGISPGSLIIIVLMLVILFGTKRLKDIGEDLGAAVKSFKKGLVDDEQEPKK